VLTEKRRAPLQRARVYRDDERRLQPLRQGIQVGTPVLDGVEVSARRAARAGVVPPA
jgi:hypothetical protein